MMAGTKDESRLRTGSLLMTIAAVGFIGYAVVFLGMAFGAGALELGITTSEVDVTPAEIEAFSPSLMNYVTHLHVAVSGFIAALGLAIVGLAWHGVRQGVRWAWGYAVGSAVLALAIALPLHYTYGLATLLHLGPIYVATAVFVAGALLSWNALAKRKRHPAAGTPSPV